MLLSTTLTATFLTITNLYLASALPALEPIAVRESLPGSVTAVYIPIDQKCDHWEQWYGRVCYNIAGLDSEWFDVCVVGPPPNNLVMKEGSCKPGEMCVPIRVRDLDDTRDKDAINCMRRPTQPTETAPMGSSLL